MKFAMKYYDIQIQKDKNFLRNRIWLCKYTGYDSYICRFCLFFPEEPISPNNFFNYNLYKIENRDKTFLGDNIKDIENSAILGRKCKHKANIESALIIKDLFTGIPLLFIFFILYTILFKYENFLLNPISNNTSLSSFDLILIVLSLPSILNLARHTIVLIKNYQIYFKELKKIEKAYKPYKNGSAINLFKMRRKNIVHGFCRKAEKQHKLTIPTDLQNKIILFYS